MQLLARVFENPNVMSGGFCMYVSNLKEKVGQNVSSSFSLCAIEQKPIVTKQVPAIYNVHVQVLTTELKQI